ncbi:MAG: hypothetical protein HC883_03820 [Bdellovibrionaceae bacterium]|nr:hypothetical protein [Pseudobdellovibrionaceae bacterium]
MPRLLYFILFVLSFSSILARGQNREIPHRVLDVLERHSCWQTSAFMALGNSKVILIAKKWAVRQGESGLGLSEVTKLSLSGTSWVSSKIQLPILPTIAELTNFPFQGDFVFSQRNNDQLLATVNVGFDLQVLFIPSRCSLPSEGKYFGDIGVGETPFGLNAQPPVPYPHTLAPSYIHHRAVSNVLVKIDRSFPNRFMGSAKSAIDKWNAAIGWQVYLFSPIKESLDPLDCLGSNSLCLFWEGPEDIGWIGWGGLTGLNFDPQNGEIQGATISLQNLSTGNLQVTPKTILQSVTNDFSFSTVARMILQKEEFKQYSHPFAEDLVEHVILHEVGHTNGLRHDFKGSLLGTSAQPSYSVMEYMPFPVTHKLNYIGKHDQDRLDLIYKNQKPIQSLTTCTDAEAKEGNDPNCLQNDLGEPTKWYQLLSNLGENGVFTIVRENQSGLPERPYLDLLGKFILNPLVAAHQETLVRDYLCEQRNVSEVLEYLQRLQNKNLTCPIIPTIQPEFPL